MMMLVCVVVVMVNCFLLIFGANFPPGISLCHKSDPNFKQCFSKEMSKGFKMFASGYPELGVPVLDPFLIKYLEITGQPGKSITLNQKYWNMYNYRLTTATVNITELDPNDNKCTFGMDMHIPLIEIYSDYELNGKMLLFPIQGAGKCNFTLHNLFARHEAICERFIKNGKQHVRFTNYNIFMKIKNAEFYFPNITRDDTLNKEVNKIINENSVDIFNDVKAGFEKVWSDLHKNTLNNVFNKIPEDELYLQ